MTNGKVSSISMCVLIFSLSKACFLGVGFHYIFSNNNPSSIINIILGILIGLGIFKIYLLINDTYQDKLFLEKINMVFKKPLNYIINIIIIISVFIISMLSIWRNIDFISTQYLYKTPTLLIGLLFISIIFYTLKTNIEVFTRAATILFFITVFFVTLNITGLLNEITFDNLKPFIFNPNIKNTIIPSFYFALLFSGPLFFLNIIPKNDIIDKEKFNKRAIISYIISSIILFLIFFVILTTLGLNIINIYKYPPYIVLKKLSILNFIESIENVTFIVWYFYLSTLSIASLFFIKNNLIKLFNIKTNEKNENIISIILSLITLIIPYIFLNNSKEITNTIINIMPIIIYSIIIIISIIYYIYYILKRILE